MSGKINTLDEKVKWYKFVESRIEGLKKKEEEKGELSLLTEMREHTTLAMVILERIRAESKGV